MNEDNSMSGTQYVLNKWKLLLLLLKITSQMRKMRPHSAPSLGPAPDPTLPTTKAQESMAQMMGEAMFGPCHFKSVWKTLDWVRKIYFYSFLTVTYCVTMWNPFVFWGPGFMRTLVWIKSFQTVPHSTLGLHREALLFHTLPENSNFFNVFKYFLSCSSKKHLLKYMLCPIWTHKTSQGHYLVPPG